MNIRNHTSTVSVDRSISLIEHCLVAVGATHIAKAYTDGKASAMIFELIVEGVPLHFRLPSRWERVFDKMWRDVRRPRQNTKKLIEEQAERTAWKLLYDQISVLTTNVMIEQQDAVEVFFPYLYDGKRDKTLYEMAKGSGFKRLMPAREAD